MFITLRDLERDIDVIVNVSLITCVHTGNESGEKCTVIYFQGNPNDMLVVKEDFEIVQRLIEAKFRPKILVGDVHSGPR